MFRLIKHKLRNTRVKCTGSLARRVSNLSSTVQVPDRADVVVIGGGSAGCNALYQFGKHRVNAVLLEKSKITSGTTWHTAGLVWCIRGPSDVEMEILGVTRSVLKSVEKETGIDPGWIKNGGLYLARTNDRWDEYKRLVTASKAFGIRAELISARQTKELFPLLDETRIRGAIYCPEDGALDPSMLINALTKSAKNNGCQIIEECPVTRILTKEMGGNRKQVYGVETVHGVIKTDVVLVAAGAWSNNVANMIGASIPLTPMKHAYVVTEPIEGLQNLPHVRDNDASMYFRIQGHTLAMGGYEQNPIVLPSAPEDFAFSLYELDWNVFNAHLEWMVELIPKLSSTGIRSTVCGPESFTPDHKAIMGEDPRCSGFFYSCGYNSAGMMLGGGCGEQIVRWIINGQPDKCMFNYDIRRFLPEQRTNSAWADARSYEAYATNYGILFPYEEPLSGRNLKIDPFHHMLVEQGAVMEESQGWEQPSWFSPNNVVEIASCNRIDATYATAVNPNKKYHSIMEKEYHFNLSPYTDIIREEAMACRKSAALFDVSHAGKFYLCGPDAQKAADYLFTANTTYNFNKAIYTCMLNHAGGVEADCTVTLLEPGSSGIVNPIFKDKAFYIVSSGPSSRNALAHIAKVVAKKSFDISLHDVTEQIGILSVQGPNSRNIVELLIEEEISDESFEYSTTKLVKIQGQAVRLIRLSFVGELGFELHIPKSSCQLVYKSLVSCGEACNAKHAGYRALRSLTCENGQLLWGSDLRTDDNPIEAGLGFVCRDAGEYLGKAAVDRSRKIGMKKKLVRFHLNSGVPLWGLEVIYRNNCLVGYLRRAEYEYISGYSIGHGYIEQPSEEHVTKEFVESGMYELEIMGNRYPVNLER